MKPISLQDSYEECRQLNKHYGTFFYHAISQFPKKDQPHIHALFAYKRILNQLVHKPHNSVTKKTQEEVIKQFAQTLKKELTESYSPHVYRQAIIHTARFHELSEKQLAALANHAIKDLKTKRYTTYADLKKHLDATSGNLADMFTQSIGYKDKKAFKHSRHLFRAGHLLDILCNISTDINLHDRIYLPKKDLQANGATAEAIKKQAVTPELKKLLESYLVKIEKELADFEKGLKHFPQQAHKALHSTSQIYRGLIDSIRKTDYNLFSRRPDVKWAHRLRCALPF